MKTTTDVMIVGAGPTGLALACTLERHGIDFLLIDQSEAPSTETKASLMTPRTIEVFQRLGLLEEVLTAGLKTYGFVIFAEGKEIARFSYDTPIADFPYALNIGQPHTERVLIGGLKSDVHRRVRMDSFLADAEAVEVRVTNPADDSSATVRARYLVACDGARSPIREQLGLRLKGKTYPTDNLVGDVVVDWDFPRDEHFFTLEREGPMVVYAMPDDRHLVTVQLPLLPGGKFRRREGMVPTLEELQKIFDERSPFPGKLSDPRWLSYYASHERGIDTFRRDRIFLAGDAVHLSSPMGGLGMNTGIQDAFSLGWMLAYVLRGFAGPALLDTYGPERLEAKALRAKVSDSNETLFAERSHLKQHLRNAAYRVIGQFEPLIDTMLERNFQMRLGFRKSPGVREFAGLPAHLTAPHDLEHGTCMAEWLAFGRGPRAGDRAPNAELSGEDGSTTRLFDLLAHPCHDLLVFTGTEPLHDQTTQQIESLVRLVAEKYAEWMRTHVIAADGAPEFSATTWRDRTGTASKRYGARGACVYLVRPDGYVGFRSLPPDPARLKEYVSTVLQPPA